MLNVTDTTAQATEVARRWHDAREKWKTELTAVEGMVNFEGMQKFLSCVRTLTGDRRLLRMVYLARK